MLNQIFIIQSQGQYSRRFPLNTFNLHVKNLIIEFEHTIFVNDIHWTWWLLLLLVIPLGILIYRKRDSISRAYRMTRHKYKKKHK